MATSPLCAPRGTVRPCPDFLPGSVREVWAVRKSDVISMPSCQCGSGAIDPASITLRTGITWKAYFFARDTSIYTEVGKVAAWGSYFEQNIEGFHPGQGADSTAEIGRLLNGHYILIIRLWSDDLRVLGSLSAPMLYLPSASSGRRRTDRAGSTWRFYGQSRFPACFASAAPSTSLPEDFGDGDYDLIDYDDIDYFTE